VCGAAAGAGINASRAAAAEVAGVLRALRVHAFDRR
jgi:hypothetical protein